MHWIDSCIGLWCFTLFVQLRLCHGVWDILVRTVVDEHAEANVVEEVMLGVAGVALLFLFLVHFFEFLLRCQVWVFALFDGLFGRRLCYFGVVFVVHNVAKWHPSLVPEVRRVRVITAGSKNQYRVGIIDVFQKYSTQSDFPL